MGDCGGMEEGNSVVAAAPSLRPSAEWNVLIAPEAVRWMVTTTWENGEFEFSDEGRYRLPM